VASRRGFWHTPAVITAGCAALVVGTDPAVCPDGIDLHGHGAISLVPSDWTAGTVKVHEGGKVEPSVGSRAYMAATCTSGVFNRSQYLALKLLGRTLRYTTDLQGAGCGCHAMFYLTSMWENRDRTKCNDYYCDANKICGAACAEIDIQEANLYAWHSTLHTRDDGAGEAGGYGGGDTWTGPRDWGSADYAPGGRCIDTSLPFQVAVSFPTDANDDLAAMVVTLSQWGHNCPLTVRLSKYPGMKELGEALKRGMTPVMSYRGTDNLQWLDGRGADLQGPCAADDGAACARDAGVHFYDFSVEEGLTPEAEAASAALMQEGEQKVKVQKVLEEQKMEQEKKAKAPEFIKMPDKKEVERTKKLKEEAFRPTEANVDETEKAMPGETEESTSNKAGPATPEEPKEAGAATPEEPKEAVATPSEETEEKKQPKEEVQEKTDTATLKDEAKHAGVVEAEDHHVKHILFNLMDRFVRYDKVYCSDHLKGILKSFDVTPAWKRVKIMRQEGPELHANPGWKAPHEKDADAVIARDLCEIFCTNSQECWGCSIDCWGPQTRWCSWNAIRSCGKMMPALGFINGDVSEKFHPSGCSDVADNCASTKCCKRPGTTCYEKNKWWSGCKSNCTPGIDEADPITEQSPWTCNLQGHKTAPLPTTDYSLSAVHMSGSNASSAESPTTASVATTTTTTIAGKDASACDKMAVFIKEVDPLPFLQEGMQMRASLGGITTRGTLTTIPGEGCSPVTDDGEDSQEHSSAVAKDVQDVVVRSARHRPLFPGDDAEGFWRGALSSASGLLVVQVLVAAVCWRVKRVRSRPPRVSNGEMESYERLPLPPSAWFPDGTA